MGVVTIYYAFLLYNVLIINTLSRLPPVATGNHPITSFDSRSCQIARRITQWKKDFIHSAVRCGKCAPTDSHKLQVFNVFNNNSYFPPVLICIKCTANFPPFEKLFIIAACIEWLHRHKKMLCKGAEYFRRPK